MPANENSVKTDKSFSQDFIAFLGGYRMYMRDRHVGGFEGMKVSIILKDILVVINCSVFDT